jgi:hypothetical protein
MSIFPQKALVCNYACASEEVFSRIDAKRQERTTASCKGGDEYIHIGQDTQFIDVRIIGGEVFLRGNIYA